ncbi:hypothetical protein RK87_014580 [Staphylococcus aureus]|nr:hypothetical protein RK87_014580 [Staphylococcus aureus]
MWAPTKKLTKSQLTIMCKLGCGPQQREIVFPISTDNASWGWDDEINFEKISYLSHSRLSRRNIFFKAI